MNKKFPIHIGSLVRVKDNIKVHFRNIQDIVVIEKDELLFYVGEKYDFILGLNFTVWIWGKDKIYINYFYVKNNFDLLFSRVDVV